MPDDDAERIRKIALQAHATLDEIAPFLDMLEGWVAATRRNGFTEEQARAIVAYLMGYRPSDGTKPDGAP